MGKDFGAPTDDELVTGVRRGNQLCCTPEYDFTCLCCLDFTVALPYERCGVMDLDAANQPAGSPTALEDDNAMPAVPPYNNSAPPPAGVVMVCTKDTAVGLIAAETDGPVTLPVQCIAREFKPAELMGTEPDSETGMPLQPGQVLLDERIDFLIEQGITASEINTCTAHYSTQGGVCPVGTPKANMVPNSAGADALGRVGAVSIGSSTAKTDQRDGILLAERAKEMTETVHRRGRTFQDIAKMTLADVEKILGQKKTLAFSQGSRAVAVHVDTVTKETAGLKLVGHGKTLVVSEGKVVLTEDGVDTEVEPTNLVFTMSGGQRMGRRGAFLSTSGSFTMRASSNRGGNT